MDDLLSVQQLQAVQQGVGKLSNERYTEALEVVLLDELIEVHPGEDGDQSR